MTDYLLERYGLTGHDKVSLPGIMQVLGCLPALEDVENLPFFQDMVEDLQGLTPPKRFSLFYPSREVLETVAKTYVQASRDYYQTWCKASGAEFYDNWASADVPAIPSHVLTLEGTFPWAPHMFYIYGTTCSANDVVAGTHDYRADNTTVMETRDESRAARFSDTATPKKQAVLNGTIPLRVEKFTDFNTWLMGKLSGATVSKATTYECSDAGAFTVYNYTYSWNFSCTWKSPAYLEAILDVQPSGPFTGLFSLTGYNDSVVDIAARIGPPREVASVQLSCARVVQDDPLPKVAAPPRILVRQLACDKKTATVTNVWVPGDGVFSDGTQTLEYAGSTYSRTLAEVQVCGTAWCPASTPVAADGSARVHMVAPIYMGDTAWYTKSKQVTVHNSVFQQSIQEDTSSAEFENLGPPGLQVGVPGFRVRGMYWSNAMATYPDGSQDGALVYRFVLELGQEARFVRAELLNTSQGIGAASTLQELETLARNFPLSSVVNDLLDMNKYNYTTAYIGRIPVSRWQTYIIGDTVFAIAVGVSRSLIVGEIQSTLEWGRGAPDNLYDEGINLSFDHGTAGTRYALTNNTVCMPRQFEITKQENFKLNNVPNNVFHYDTQFSQSITFASVVTTVPYDDTHTNVHQSRQQERYLYIWVPCTALRGVGLSYDGPMFTGTYSFVASAVRTQENSQVDSDVDNTEEGTTTASSSGDIVSSGAKNYGYVGYHSKYYTPGVGVTRWMTATGADVDLFSLLDVDDADLPPRIYAGGRAPFEAPTEQELRVPSCESVFPASHAMESNSEIRRAIEICSALRNAPSTKFGPLPDVTDPYQYNYSYLFIAVNGMLEKELETVPTDLLTSISYGLVYKLQGYYAWDPVSAYATRLLPLPSGLSWLHQGAAVAEKDVLLLRRYRNYTSFNSPLLDVAAARLAGKGYDSATVSLSYYELSPLGTELSQGAYSSDGADECFTYVNPGATTLGIAAPQALAVTSPRFLTVLTITYTGTTLPVPTSIAGTSSRLGTTVALRSLMHAPGGNNGTMSAEYLQEDISPASIRRSSLSVSPAVVGLWVPRVSAQTYDFTFNSVYDSESVLPVAVRVRHAIDGSGVFNPYSSVLFRRINGSGIGFTATGVGCRTLLGTSYSYVVTPSHVWRRL